MDERWSLRKRLELDVDLYYEGRQISGCKTGDIGLGGMFIRSAATRVPRFGRVEVALKKDGGECHRFRGRVMHHGEQGFGVAFQEFNVDDLRALQQVIWPN